ncbi:MAG: CUAEP/CCAEP-tail radical SAM (seleno)protein [Pyrinomonadaceae bacterium]
MNVVLISTYELGHQPFGLASPAAWLKEVGASVACLDLAVENLSEGPIRSAHLIAFYLPMHTATRIAVTLLPKIREINPNAHLCFYGLYAPLNEGLLRTSGADTIIGGEFEQELVALYGRLREHAGDLKLGPQPQALITLSRQQFLAPDRSGLPRLSKYAHLDMGDGSIRVAGYTEASRGCKHLCRHCPIVPVYNGMFRVVQREVVLEDIKSQVEAGARHITFGDPDFFNGVGHAVPIVESLHRLYPELTYDVTIKIEHLLKHARHLPTLRDTGCLFVVSAVEAVDNNILQYFDKGHTRADFFEAVALLKNVGLTLNPTFVAFNPWITLEGYLDLLEVTGELGLVDHVAPIQYAIRLLIPASSRLLELPEVRRLAQDFDEQALCYRWSHPDPRVDELQRQVMKVVQRAGAKRESRHAIFGQVLSLARQATGAPAAKFWELNHGLPLAPIPPHMSEPWFC